MTASDPPSASHYPLPTSHWFDPSWWAEQLACVAIDDPVLCNLHVTLAHYELSLALREVLGSDTGANFHTWATWGSIKAGTTIRQEDVLGLRPLAGAVGGGLASLALGRRARLRAAPLAGLGGALLGATALSLLADRMLDTAARQILGGNRTVLDDIGRVTARFVVTFHDHPERDPERLETFLATLRPGPPDRGGQDLLKSAFRHYHGARHEPDLNRKHEHMLLANLQAIVHEHVRLQPYIAGAMPGPMRRLITSRLLNFRVGMHELSVSRDVVAWDRPDAPKTLRTLESPELVRFLSGVGGWDRTPDSLAGSRARDWADIRDRMNYIVDLFRSRHFDPSLFAPPFTDNQRADLLAGRVPAGLG